MKKIVKGNDFTMRVIVNKIVDGEQQPFSLPACEEVKALAVGRYRRYELQTRVDAKDDSVLLVRVEGDKLPLGKYALEVKGKLFGNDWRSNEYCQFALVDSNAEADTEFRRDLVEGEDSVEMDTAIVFLPPEAGLTELADKLKAETLKDVKAELDRQLPTDAYECAKKRGYEGTEEEYYATFTEIGHLKENIKGTLDEMTEAEKLRANAETERAKAETERQRKQDSLNTAEGARVQNEQQRQTNEETRQQAEKDRATAESNRASAEVERANAEQQRSSTEEARNTAESQRAKDELARVGWESERAKAETQRQTDEELRKQAETERANSETARKGNEDARTRAEQQRNATEEQRAEAERQRVQQETSRQQAENARVNDEQLRADSETKRQQAERERVQAENVRTENENKRLADEQTRADEETKRISAEQLRMEAETKRVAEDAKIKETLEYVNAQKYIKENEYESEVRAIEAIKNAPKDPTQDVWLDATDGEIKSGPAEGNLTKNAITYYYLGKRVIKGNFSGPTREHQWTGNTYIRHLDVRNWDMTLCTDASLKFYGYSNLVFLDTSNWNLSALTNGQQMFSGCISLHTLDTSNWNLSALTNGQQMFSGCISLHTLDTSNWNLSALTNGNYMFSSCGSLQTLDLRSSSFHNVSNATAFFESCNSLAELWLPLTFDKLTSLNLTIPSWGSTDKGLASLRWTFGDGADDRTAKDLQPCTVRLHADVYDRLTDNERAAAAKKGWTITK